MGRKIWKDIHLKEKFLEMYADIRKYKFNVGKICRELGINREETFDVWMTRQDFVRRLEQAKLDAVDTLREHYITLFLENNDRMAGETLLKILDPKNFGEENHEKGTIKDLIEKVAEQSKKHTPKNFLKEEIKEAEKFAEEIEDADNPEV